MVLPPRACSSILFLVTLFFQRHDVVDSFTLVMMGARRGKKGNLKRSLDDKKQSKPSSARSLNKGKGQEITGVTLPASGKLKGWEFGEGVRICCANVGGDFFAVQGQCPRCGFDLWKGDLIADDEAFEDLPRVACPTCSTTFSFRNGNPGPPLKRGGLQKFVSGLASKATVTDSYKNAKAFQITRDLDQKVYMREL